ncbi:MAG: putative Arabinose efflux permease family protein [Acidobacteria bacterium]|nr:putative Arabinose efflux permease family protein [Acidobacteriota bacterium]
MSLDETIPPTTGPPPPPEAGFPAGRVLTVSAGHAAHDTYAGFLPVLLPHFVERFTLSNTQAGWLSAFASLPSILQPVFGHLADRLVLRWVVILAPAITATLMSLTGWAPSYLALAFLLGAAGLSSAAFHAVGSAAAGRLSARHLGRGMSLWMVGGELGSTLGPMLAAAALTVLTMKELGLVMVLGWAASFLLYLQLRRVPLQGVSGADRPHWRHSLGRMRRLMLLMGALILLRALALSAASVFSPLLLKGEGSSGFVAGAAVALFQAAGVAGTLAAGWLSDRLGRRPVLLFGVLAGPAGLLLFVSLHGWVRFAFLALAGATLVSLHPVYMALVQESFPESRGLANAVYLSMVFVISSAAAVAVGALGDALSLRWAFVVGALVTLLSLPLLLLLPRQERVAGAAG